MVTMRPSRAGSGRRWWRRRWTSARPAVISFVGGYHGRTSLTLAMTGKVRPYKVAMGPFAEAAIR